MRELTSAKEVLDLVPLPIYRKDSERRFVYANPGYLKDISEGSSRETGAQREFALHDVIGMTDRYLPRRYRCGI